MKEINYPQAPGEIQSAIENVARVFDGYKLDEKPTPTGFSRCWNGLTFHDYTITGNDSSSILTVKSGKAGKKLSEEESDQLDNTFLAQLQKILSKEITITPEIANVNPYKPVSSGSLVYSLLVLAVAIYGIYWAIKAFFL